MNLHKIPPEFKTLAWMKFRQHHYTPNEWNRAARAFLATEVFGDKEVIVGLSAALYLTSGTVTNAWHSHKVVVLPPRSNSGVLNSSERIILPDFDSDFMWRTLADKQAALFIEDGFRYYCNASDAPPELIAYRGNPASGWIPTTKHGKPPRDDGRNLLSNKPRATNAAGLVVSHEYVGVKV